MTPKGTTGSDRGALAPLTASVLIAALLALAPVAGPVGAEERPAFSRDTPSQRGRDRGQYIPAIAITPDGCEVWIMDDGFEGYAENRLDRDGRPICHPVSACKVVPADQLFPTDSATIPPDERARLERFFAENGATGFIIAGHADARGSDAYNMDLSRRRAEAVAAIARAAGAHVVDVQAYGERRPVASNATDEGRALNRRVEIGCVE